MATPIDKLIVEIRAETKQLRKEFDKVNSKLGKTKKQTDKLQKGFMQLASGIGVGVLAKSIVDTNRKFEDLEATLRAVVGGAEAASASFALIRKFTAQTTFQVDEVAQAFITLFQAGVKPSEDALRDFGNFAAGMGKSITDLAQATFNATTGEMEMLKRFGVVARLEGDKIRATFEGQTEIIERSGDAITEFLRKIGRERFAGAIEERANTITGAFSNLSDAVDEFQVQIGEAGLNAEIIKLAKNGTELVKSLEPLAEQIGALTGLTLQLANSIINLTQKITEITSETSAFSGELLSARNLVETFVSTRSIKNILTLLDVFKMMNKDARGSADEFDKLVNTSQTLKDVLTSDEFKKFTFLDSLIKKLDPAKLKLEDFQKETGKLIKETLETAVAAQLALEKIAMPLQFGRVMFKGTDREFFKVFEGAESRRREEILKEMLGGFENVDQLIEAILGLNKASEGSIKIGDHLREVIQAQALAFSDDFVNAILSGQDALESFKDFSRNIVSQIVAIFLQLGVVNRILNGIFGEGTFDVLGRNEAGKLSIIPAGTGDAGGGTLQRNTPTLVGERGAEIFVPNTGGTLLNNMNSKNAMGGQPVNIYQNVNFSTGIVPTVRAEVMSMLPQIAEVTKGAVQESAMRGGSFRRSLIGG